MKRFLSIFFLLVFAATTLLTAGHALEHFGHRHEEQDCPVCQMVIRSAACVIACAALFCLMREKAQDIKRIILIRSTPQSRWDRLDC